MRPAVRRCGKRETPSPPPTSTRWPGPPSSSTVSHKRSGASVNALKRLLPIALVLTAGCGYNTIQTYDEQVTAAASQIKVQLQRRADLVPNLVETVKGYAKQEQTIFTAVAEARAKLAGARSEEHTSELQSPCNLVCRLLL